MKAPALESKVLADAKANLAYIHRAVNAHAELVAALEPFQSPKALDLDPQKLFSLPDNQVVFVAATVGSLKRARAALAKARQEDGK